MEQFLTMLMGGGEEGGSGLAGQWLNPTALFGSSSSSSQNTQSSQNVLQQMLQSIVSNSSMEQNQVQDSDMLSQMLQEISGTTTQFSGEQENQLNQSLSQLMQELSGAREGVATAADRGADMSQDAMSAAVAEVMRSGIGEVAEIGSNTGSYNSTSQAAAATQLGSRAAETGARVRLESQQNQQALAQQQLQSIIAGLSGLFGQAKGGTTTTTQSVQSREDQKATANTNVTGSETSEQVTDETSEINTETDSTTDSTDETDGLLTGLI